MLPTKFYLLASLCILEIFAEVLTPPYFNIATNKKVEATYTCGEDVDEPELYCKLVGAVQDTNDRDKSVIRGQVCDYCDSNDPDKRHPPNYAVDGTENYWLSPPLSRGTEYNKVNFTIDLGQDFHVAYIIIKMGISPRPGLWVLERSSDNGKTYKPWQYFAERETDCETFFGAESLMPITHDDSVICTTQFSKIVPLEHGEIVVSILNGRPSSEDFFNSTTLQEWTRATNVRLSLLRTQTLYGHLMSVERQDPTVTRRYFYSIKDISIGGRCRCNGHAEDCIETKEDKYKLKCVCQHDTCGDNCDRCCPNKVQKKWQQSKANKLFVCEGCNCHGHSNQCVYNETVDKLHLSLDLRGNYEGGGVCVQCRDNTEGINCEKCKPGYFLPFGVEISSQNACTPCNCTGQQYTGNCEHGTGRCECKQNYVSPFCDACSFGYTNYPECEPCKCNINGTINDICDPINNVCPCKPNYDGPQCANCSKGSYDFPNCKRCNCNKIGSLDDFCDPFTGDCECKNNYAPQKCDICNNGYFAFPACNLCNCNTLGTVDEVCDKDTGKCLCKEGYTGENCGECIAGFKNFPNCESCNCTEIGSQSLICDSNGKCPCLEKFSGQTCNECSPGYYNYPQCTSCNCDPYGTLGKSCDNEGNCKCRENFYGKHCDKCKEGLYNYPICEACDCDPAGVTANFTGCGKIKGELCQCKPRVEGRKCNECKPLYWDLQKYNPHGCSDCECHLPGVIGAIAECNSKKRGQCYCKKSVISRKCDHCADGSYNLQENNVFGCTDCSCDIGGALPNACNKTTGQCVCRNRITGRTCDRPEDFHYFPTLYQLKFEAEDWKSADNENARIDFNETIFPDFSWRGYAILASTQKLIRQRIYIEYMSFYQIIARYVNRNEVPITGVIKLKESATEDVQSFKVVFPPSSEPSFITVGGEQGNVPSTNLFISESRGMWEISLETPWDAPPLFVDYVVLMPDSYYEGHTLVEHVKNPCKSGEKGSCLFYEYPSLENFISAKPIGLSNEYLNFDDGWHPPVPILSQEQIEMGLNVPTQDDKELKVIVVNYATPLDINQTATLNLNIHNGVNSSEGIINLTPCHYNFLCRQVVLDKEGRVAKFLTSDSPLEIIFKNSGAPKTAIENVVLIPTKDWNFDYVSPSVSCIMKNSECLNVPYPLPVGMKKVEFETDIEINKPKTTYPKVLDPSVILLRSDESQEITINGKVPSPGNFLFIVHYYQPISPEITTPVLVETDYSYNGTLKFQHCPSQVGCRSVIYGPRSDLFYVTNEFNITFRENRTVWLDYVLIVPENQFKSHLLKQEAVNNAERFKSECGSNHFYVDEKNTSEFCKKAIFSLTSDFNNGALKCQCNHLGSKNFTCAPFGGQCQCRDFVIGRKCEECKANYWGFPNCKPCECAEWAICDKDTGQCSCPKNIEGEKCDKCKPLTYDFNFYSGCLDCNCHPLGVKDNNLQCDLNTGHCTCKENVDGRKCDKCRAGYHSFPYCEECDCDRRGTTDEICDAYGSGECSCKRNVEGVVCDLCIPGTYNLDSENPDGCTECFCFNRTSECSSSRFYWDTLKGLEDWGLVAIKVKKGLGISVTELSTPPESIPPAIGVDLTAVEIGDQEIYFRTSEKYLGNKLASYGGRLKYSIFCTTGISGDFIFSSDIILSGAGIDLFFSSVSLPNAAELFEMDLLIKESNFKLSNGLPASRGHLMQVLQDLQAIYIKATYWEKSVTTRIQNFSMDISSKKYTNNGVALSIEQCNCPPQYSGLSCEECADGYYRSSTGSFGGFCVPCQCNGHASTCDKVTGVCKDCEHDTSGDHCEKCSEGFYGDATYGTPWDCNICACPLPIPKNNFAKSCEVSDDGSQISCNCNEGYYGHRCQSCANGYYGNPEIENDYCKPCECSGNINITDVDACDSVSGECIKCLSNTAGPACNYCKPGFYGDAVKLKNCQSCSCHEKGTFRCDHSTGACECHPNVEGEKCDRCAENHYLFDSGQGCIPCNCANASISKQCDDTSGQCRCQPGVTGRSCEKCDQGYWNYTSQGCTKCLCNLQNSIKVGCNENGQCECLKDVIGEKCDGCPDRWVFVEKEGCFPCGKCVHDLLDTVDVIKERLQPIRTEFDSVAKSYYIQRRLQYINESAIALRPLVNNIGDSAIDLAPTLRTFDELQQEVDRIARKNAYTILKANGTANDSLISQSSALDENVNKEIKLALEAIQGAKETVANVILIGNSFEEPSQLDLTQQEALEEAKKIYEELKQKFDPNNRKFITKESVQLSYLERAEASLKDVEKFKEPVDEREKALQALGKRIEEIRKRIKDANRLALESLKSSKKLSDKTQENMRMSLPSKYETINNRIELSKTMMIENSRLLDNISSLLAMSSSDLYSKFKSSKEEFIPLTEDLVKLTDTKLTTDAVRNASISVSKAEKWANALEKDANELKQIGEQPVTDTSEVLIYNQIINALRSALMTAERAKLDAEAAKDITSGIGSNASSTYENSAKIFEKANALLKEAKTNLSNYLDSTVNEVKELEREKDKIIAELDSTDKILDSMEIKRNNEDFITDMENADRGAQDILSETKTISNELSELLDSTKNMSAKKRDADSALSETDRTLEDIKKIVPNVNILAEKLKDKPEQIKVDLDKLKEKLKALNDQVALAREAANKIPLVASFDPKTTLELAKPNDLPDQAINNLISLYFKTRESNALIFFIGNPASNERRSKRTASDGEFMALEVQNGEPKLTVDLGSGPTSVVTKIHVSNDHWHQAIMERTGKVIRLTIIPPTRQVVEAEDFVAGTSFVLNLDKSKSKIFVGGIPASFNTPPHIQYNYFDGSIDGLVIGDTPVSLWNFIEKENLQPDYKRGELGNVSSTIGCRFDGEGYVALSREPYKMDTTSQISLSFQTKAKEGLLFLAHQDDNFISIELREGRVFHQFDLGNGVVTMSSSKPYNDNMWHTVTANRLYSKGSIIIDGEVEQSLDNDDDKSLFKQPEKFYIGGYPGNHNIEHVTNMDFDGCINDVQLESIVNLNINIESTGTKPGCPPKFDRVVSFEVGAPGYLLGPNITADDNTMELLLSFRTTSPDGLLAYAWYGSPSITLSLRDGQLLFRSGSDEVLSDSPKPYNDGNWHSVTAHFDEDKMELNVDDKQIYTSSEPPKHVRMLHGQVYFGGVPSSVDAESAFNDKFVGCISDATLNNAIVNFASTTESSQAIIGKCAFKPSGIPPPPIQPKPRPAEPPIIPDKPSPKPEKTTTTPPPISRDDNESCKLPLYPNIKENAENVGYRLGTRYRSRIEYMALPGRVKAKYDFSIEIKTEAQNGVIFFASNKRVADYISLFLRDGQVVYIFNCGSGEAYLTSDGMVNDNKWHTVAFKRNGEVGTLIVDGNIVSEGRSEGMTKTLNVTAPYFIGGLDTATAEVSTIALKGVNESLDGCVRNFKVNGQLVTKSRNEIGVIPCSDDEFEHGIYFAPEGGYVKQMEKFSVGKRFDAMLSVKPRVLSGLLLAIHGKKDYFVLELVDGAVVAKVFSSNTNIINTYIPPLGSNYLCDGNWHTITVSKQLNLLTLGVDTMFSEVIKGDNKAKNVQTKHTLYLGGNPERNLPGVTSKQYVGCIKDVVINQMSEKINVKNAIGNVTSSACPIN